MDKPGFCVSETSIRWVGVHTDSAQVVEIDPYRVQVGTMKVVELIRYACEYPGQLPCILRISTIANSINLNDV